MLTLFPAIVYDTLPVGLVAILNFNASVDLCRSQLLTYLKIRRILVSSLIKFPSFSYMLYISCHLMRESSNATELSFL